jgi:hypothetical protein
MKKSGGGKFDRKKATEEFTKIKPPRKKEKRKYWHKRVK